MYVRLTVKLAQVVEGVDLSDHAEGDIIDLADHDAQLLVKGGWAEPIPADERVKIAKPRRSDVAADRGVTG
jgi:hypothetical protein